MRETLFHVERLEATTLQAQIREMLVNAVLAGQLAPGEPIPSTRAMARRLKVSRNTVTSAYQALADDGYLEVRDRSGFFVAEGMARQALASDTTVQMDGGLDWSDRFNHRPSAQSNIDKPANWQDYPYPFIYGQVDRDLFPLAAWRDCLRQAMSRKWLNAWTDDQFAQDDPMLVEQIRRRVLTRRGVMARPDEILITLGAQNALHLLTTLLIRPGTRFALEDPGFPDVRNMAALHGANVRPIAVNQEGLVVDSLNGEDIVFVTPSHQFPTNATMSLARRRHLLNWADANDALILEDDYEYETNYDGPPTPALKSLDRHGRVLYVGSLSKSLMPGLRVGFLVAPAPVIVEARALRRLAFRHPPGNNQRVVALFLALGHHDALVARLHKVYSERATRLRDALESAFPGWVRMFGFGGSSLWLVGPPEFDASALARRAREAGVLIEPGDVHFADSAAGRNTFRMGFSSIATDRIAAGVERLEAAYRDIVATGSPTDR